MAKSKPDKSSDQQAKRKNQAKRKKPAKSDSGKTPPTAQPYSSIATHPRASASVQRVKAWAGLTAFVIAGLLSLKADVPFAQTGLRAIAAGVAAYLLAWWFSLLVWKHLMLAEQQAAVDEIKRRRAAQDHPDPSADG